MSVTPYSDREDPRMHRLWNPETEHYLHMSGKGETANPDHSWLGFASQAAVLRDRAKTSGESWPYIRVSRNAHIDEPIGGDHGSAL